MSESLQSRLQRIRHRVRQVLCLYGVSWVVAVVFGATLVVGLLDWLVHLDDPGVRLILGLGILAAGAWVGWRFLVSPLLRPFSDVDLALRIEERYPRFNDSLASTVQFLEGGTDPRFGSPDLQRRVIEETMGQVEQVDMADVVETREVRRVASIAITVCVLTAVVVGFNQSAASIALNRLLFPFSAGSWPKNTHLRLINADLEPIEPVPREPLRIARGDTLDLYVENVQGKLPIDVVLEYRFGEGADQSGGTAGTDAGVTTSKPLHVGTLRDKQGRSREVGALDLTVARGPMWFRAVGGDDAEMPWYELHVVPPPVVEDFKVTLTPPAYSGQEPERLPEGVGHVRGLVGTRVEIDAGVNKRLRTAKLRVKDQAPLPISLSEDGRRLQTSFVIEEGGVYSYWFDLRDRQGFENAEAPRYEIRGIADLPPEVYIDTPPTDLNVTADAQVPLKLAAKDDLGLREIRLHYKLGDSGDSSGSVLPLYTAGDAEERLQHLEVEHLWELSELSLVEGMRIVFHAEAADDYDLGPEQVGRSISRTLRIVSSEEKQAELASRQAELLDELEQLSDTQGRAREQVGELLVQLDKADRLQSQDLDMLKRIELDQRRISSGLLSPVDGLEGRARELTDELRHNHIDNPEMQGQLERMAEELSLLDEENLPIIEQELTRARKSAEAQDGDSRPPESQSAEIAEQTAALRQAGEHQGAVLESLGEMLRQLAEWRSRRDLDDDLHELIEVQEEMNRQSAEISRRTLTRPLADLAPQERADLARLADRQNVQADRLGQLRDKLREMAETLRERNPSAAEATAEAEAQLAQQATVGRMREAATQLEQNQVGRATSGQQDVLDDLHELRDILQDRSTSDTETLVKKLKQAEQELDGLQKQQEELLRKVQEAGQNPEAQQREQELERLRKEQQQLREEVAGMARRLRRLQARQAGQSTRRAAARMQQAEGDLGEDDGTAAEQHQQESLEDLEQARRELARQRREAEERLAHELLERIADDLQGMIARQQNVIDETQRLDAAHQERGNWSRGQLRSLRDLEQVQRDLKGETDRLVEQVQAAEVFALALQGASRHMQTAADRLSDRKTDQTTLDAEQSAQQRFVDLVAALEPEQDAAEAGAQAGGQAGDNGEGAGPPTDGIPQLAQLKMLKTLQEDVVQRTTELDEIRLRNGELTDREQADLEMLAGEQGRLADLARNLVQRVTEAFEFDEEEDR